MTPGDVLYRFRVRTLALAEELGNVRAACRAMGIHHSTFYRWLAHLGASVSRCCDPASATELARPSPKWSGLLLSASGVGRCWTRRGPNEDQLYLSQKGMNLLE